MKETTIYSEKDILNLTKNLNGLYHQLKEKLPYHINVIELLRANENAHSRILLHLLQYYVNGRYEILDKFIKEFIPKFQFQIEKPSFSAEKHRIDLLIRDRNYAIIIENKIHGATDQDKQIERYIEEVNQIYGIRLTNIFVIYLSRDISKTIGEKSLTEKAKNWLEEERFCHITYRENILPWLQKDVLPQCRLKDVYLQSALHQYIDHLEYLFDLRTINSEINMELQKYLRDTLNLENIPENNHKIIAEKLSEANRLLNQLNILKDETEKECWGKWYNQLKKDFPQYESAIFNHSDDKKYPKIGITFDINGNRFSVLIEKETNIYYGIGRHYATNELETETEEYVKRLFEKISAEGFQNTNWWYGWKYTSWENGYRRVSDLIRNVISDIEAK